MTPSDHLRLAGRSNWSTLHAKQTQVIIRAEPRRSQSKQ